MKKIGLQEQFITAYGGLRGAVAFSLANMLDQTIDPRKIFITTTLMVILFTGFIQVRKKMVFIENIRNPDIFRCLVIYFVY